MPRFCISIDSRNNEETRQYLGNGFRPPQLGSHHHRASNPQLDDEVFMSISLNLLARYEALGLSARESIESVLIGAEEQSAFHDALTYRILHGNSIGAYSSCSMIQKIEDEFGDELKAICSLTKQTNQGPVQAPMTPCNARNQARFNWFLNPRHKGQRNFFPDNESRHFLRRNKRSKVRNIDWHVTAAVQQVVSLSLEGTHTSELRGGIAVYKPPSPMHGQRTG